MANLDINHFHCYFHLSIEMRLTMKFIKYLTILPIHRYETIAIYVWFLLIYTKTRTKTEQQQENTVKLTGLSLMISNQST